MNEEQLDKLFRTELEKTEVFTDAESQWLTVKSRISNKRTPNTFLLLFSLVVLGGGGFLLKDVFFEPVLKSVDNDVMQSIVEPTQLGETKEIKIIAPLRTQTDLKNNESNLALPSPSRELPSNKRTKNTNAIVVQNKSELSQETYSLPRSKDRSNGKNLRYSEKAAIRNQAKKEVFDIGTKTQVISQNRSETNLEAGALDPIQVLVNDNYFELELPRVINLIPEIQVKKQKPLINKARIKFAVGITNQSLLQSTVLDTTALHPYVAINYAVSNNLSFRAAYRNSSLYRRMDEDFERHPELINYQPSEAEIVFATAQYKRQFIDLDLDYTLLNISKLQIAITGGLSFQKTSSGSLRMLFANAYNSQIQEFDLVSEALHFSHYGLGANVSYDFSQNLGLEIRYKLMTPSKTKSFDWGKEQRCSIGLFYKL